MEASEKSAAAEAAEKLVAQKMAHVRQRQSVEIETAEGKLERGKDEIKVKFAEELEIMLKKYQNMKKELVNS
jgi:hypothetical protein